mgnify:CR=1 FL=1|tara:strand:+ start:999 stop:1265 length:267 start_codon:yes stop_codon:yes gene_type:complete
MQFRKELDGGVYLHLKKKIPSEIVFNIKEYVKDNVQKTQKYNMKFICWHINNIYLRQMKRCTPCERCHQKKTYTRYCHTCDALVWIDT